MPLAVKPVTPVDAVAVHAKVAPDTLDVSVTSVEAAPEQIVCVNGLLLTVGVGFTVINTYDAGTELHATPFNVEIVVRRYFVDIVSTPGL